MARVPGREAVYEVADLFRQRCLIEGKSLLWPDQAIWTVENLDQFWNAFVGNPDESGNSFISKFERQLANESNPVHQIAADIMVMYCLPISSGKMGRASKRNFLTTVMSWKLGDQSENAEWLKVEQAFADGVADPGMFYMIAGRPWHVAYLLRFGKECRSRQSGDLPGTAARELADDVLSGFTSGQLEIRVNVAAGRHFLLHLLFPDNYESIASTDHKQKLVRAFSQDASIDPSTDLDDALLEIRNFRESNLGPDSTHYYHPEIFPLWNPPKDPPKPKPDPNVQPVAELGGSDVPHPVPVSPSIEALAAMTHLDEAFLREIASLLAEKRQIIFEGPPGSGKTYVAELFARWFTGQALDDGLTSHVEIVQFHQSYG